MLKNKTMSHVWFKSVHQGLLLWLVFYDLNFCSKQNFREWLLFIYKFGSLDLSLFAFQKKILSSAILGNFLVVRVRGPLSRPWDVCSPVRPWWRFTCLNSVENLETKLYFTGDSGTCIFNTFSWSHVVS